MPEMFVHIISTYVLRTSSSLYIHGLQLWPDKAEKMKVIMVSVRQ